MKHSLICFLLSFISVCLITGQNTTIDLEAYQNFLAENKNMTTEDLLLMYPAGIFADSLELEFDSAEYFDSIDIKYALTDNEKELLTQNGFVVTERLQQESFIEHFDDIWHKDLPVFFSTDAMLHAFHSSYDRILMDVEESYLIQEVTEMINQLHGSLDILNTKYSSQPEMQSMLHDVDLYLTIALKLIGDSGTPYYSENENDLNEIMNMIQSETMESYALFSSSCKKLDFSQFTIRGHYTQSESHGKYFPDTESE